MTVSQAIEYLGRINLGNAVQQAVRDTAADYAKLNEDQWKEGVNSDASPLDPLQYSPGYKKVREREGLQTAHVDFKRTGAFYKGFSVALNNFKEVVLTSDVEYEKYLTKRYGARIWGLTPENIAKYREIVRPRLLELIRKT